MEAAGFKEIQVPRLNATFTFPAALADKNMNRRSFLSAILKAGVAAAVLPAAATYARCWVKPDTLWLPEFYPIDTSEIIRGVEKIMSVMEKALVLGAQPAELNQWSAVSEHEMTHETPLARLYSKVPPERHAEKGDEIWIPRSIVEHTSKMGNQHIVTLSEWFVQKAGL